MNKIAMLESSSRLVVTYRPVGDLIPDPRNARTHPKRQIDQIRKSIEAFGFTNPILADPEGHVIAGHGRLQAAQLMGAAARVSRDGAIHFVCMDWRHMDDVSAVGRTIYGERLNLCIWNKSNAGMGSLYRSKHELVFVYRVGTAPHLNMVELGRHGRNRSNVWDYASVNSLRGNRREDLALHPTVKPTGLVADAIMDVTRRGDLVLDLFLGSGTTLLAADRTGRRFRGLDIDPAYVDVAIERWSARTGLEPRLEGPAS